VSDYLSVEPAAVVFVDYAKGALWPPTLTRGVLRDRERSGAGWLPVLDVKPTLLGFLQSERLLRDCVVKCNLAEWQVHHDTHSRQDCVEWAAKHQVKALYVTRGGDGCFAVSPDGFTWDKHPKSESRHVNVCGAGDVFTAGLVAQLLQNRQSITAAGYVAYETARRTVQSGQRETLVVLPTTDDEGE
jgi:sugar/nucleoside kinase (ribokinase family)